MKRLTLICILISPCCLADETYWLSGGIVYTQPRAESSTSAKNETLDDGTVVYQVPGGVAIHRLSGSGRQGEVRLNISEGRVVIGRLNFDPKILTGRGARRFVDGHVVQISRQRYAQIFRESEAETTSIHLIFYNRQREVTEIQFLRRVEETQTAQPGATDNPDDAQRLREDH